jgi:murein L,D-transpeptidase YcbB/YkuD
MDARPTVNELSPLILDPSHCQWGSYNTFPASSMPTIKQGSNTSYVGYAMGVLWCKASQPCPPHANPGPWYFGVTFTSCVKTFQTFFGLTVDGIIGQQTWPYVQLVANQ